MVGTYFRSLCLIGAFWAVFVVSRPVGACTTVSIPQSKSKIVANNYDWAFGSGMAFVNKRHVEKQAQAFYETDTPAKWVSRYGSVSFNQYGREFPLGGMNEMGLVVEIMWLDSSEYPKPDGKPSVNELQWIQYQLDNFANVGEVLSGAPKIRVSKVYAAVHYMVCDGTGACATFEYIGGQLVTHSGPTMPVNTLTNDPYKESLAFLTQFVGFGGARALPKGTESLPRFVRASALAKEFDPEKSGSATDYAFEILNNVSQGANTMWHIVYETVGNQISFQTQEAPATKGITAAAFDYSCKAPVKMFDMNEKLSGDVTSRFTDYSAQANRDFLFTSLKDFIPLLPPGTIDKAAAYPETTRCTE